jgi:hypothetical protein
VKKTIIKTRNVYAIHAWNRRAGKHKDKKWFMKNRQRGKVDINE